VLQQKRSLLNHLVGMTDQWQRHADAKRPGGLCRLAHDKKSVQF
jgi:hypothetical protein